MLNDKQQMAVEHISGPCLTLAGPGSGKTTVLIERICSLIDSGIAPESILVITFTRDAARQMEERFYKKTGPKHFGVTFGTFHSIFYKILKNSREYSSYSILYGKRKYLLYKECIKALGISLDVADFITDIEKDVSFFMNTGMKMDNDSEFCLPKEEFLLFISELESRKKAHKLIDFDDMLVKTKKLLLEDSNALKFWQNKYSYFLVDELQDINGVQFDVLNILLNNHPSQSQNIFGVGDDDQAIYGFRGANPKFMLEFPKYFKDCKIIVLDKNYRSAVNIVEGAKSVIKNNVDRYDKEFSANNKDAGNLLVSEFDDNMEEAKYIVNKLKQELNNGKSIDTAILYRNRSSASIITALLKQNNIDFYIDEAVEDIKNSEICKDLISYFKLVLGKYKREDIIRVMNRPFRSLERGGLDDPEVNLFSWKSFYPRDTYAYSQIDKLIKNLELMKVFTPFSCINYIRKGMGYDDYLRSIANIKGADSKGNIDKINEIHAFSKEFDTLDSFIKEMDVNEEPEKKVKTKENVCLYTFHGSKGLEFDRVFILDAIEGVTPSKNADSVSKTEEERRMFYVAMTRAKSELVICIPKKISDEICSPSRFIGEIDERYLYV